MDPRFQTVRSFPPGLSRGRSLANEHQVRTQEIRVAQTCPPKSLAAEKQENGVSLSQFGKLCVHSSSVGMNFRNLTIFHGGGGLDLRGASGFQGEQ
ncbi:hypothetical protein ACRRTK_008797 [Alexandromys fortis]